MAKGKPSKNQIEFLSHGLDALRQELGGWKELASEIDISVPMLYAFQKGSRLPMIDTAVDLGLLDARICKTDELDRCKAWLQASDRSVPQDIERIIEMRKNRLREKPITRVLEVAEKFTDSDGHLHPTFSIVFGLLEQLWEGHAKAIERLKTDVLLMALSNACSQEAATASRNIFLKDNADAHIGFVWNWDNSNHEGFLDRFRQLQAKKTFHDILEPPAVIRNDWAEKTSRTKITGCIFIPNSVTDAETALKRLKDVAKEFCDKSLDVCPNIYKDDERQDDRFCLYTATLPNEIEHYADVWWFAGKNELEGVWIPVIDEKGNSNRKNNLKQHIERLGEKFAAEIWKWTVCCQSFDGNRLLEYLKIRGFNIEAASDMHKLTVPGTMWKKIFPVT